MKAKPRRNGKLRTIIVVSDIHAGCRLALCPADGVSLDDGGDYMPSEFQRKIWDWWTEFWNVWVPQATDGERYAVVVNGDCIDGSHHRSTTQISQNIEDQVQIAYQILKPIADANKGRFYIVRGTEAHVGQSGKDEESLAKRLGAVPNRIGQCARWELNKRLGRYVINFMHHIGTTSSSAHETSAINAELAAAFVEAGRWEHTPPRIVVRSHRHRCAEVRIPAKDGYAIGFVTPAWQGKTPFAYKVAGGRMTTPQFGGSLIRLSDDGELYTRHWVRDLQRESPE